MSPFFSFREIVPLASERKQQIAYLKAVIEPELAALEKQYNTAFSKLTQQKIFDYYAVFVPVVLGKSFCRLFGRDLQPTELRLQTLQGIITPFFDDFFDIENLPDERIRLMMENPFEATPHTLMQEAFIKYGKEIKSNVKDISFFNDISEKVFAAQILSRKQELSSISRDEVKTITAKKGGTSLLFYYSVLDLPKDDTILQIIYDTGSLLQLSNDIFDTYKDREKSIITLPACYTNIVELHTYFTEQYNTLCDKILSLPFPKKNIRSFFFRINVMLTLTFVALEQFVSIQEKHGGKFILKNCSRKELICDRAKMSNLVKWFRYTYQLHN
ncbi:hypothetical protein A9P82_00645 [Arachidicoccus ginsenosidimutans]|uniref:class 1 isoprenoid biosynthesis enzyme n=1 Tax=Arachidicoccus sp. BS20 TaxID=1850526 RepID=UPI0007F105E9|nr:class 1 isoprenoid biosynthesis enzyme [Arachidicoccus sp. BS20]ANI87954.1 hypothetical protein A9P82_00645 [Arachidicoccus sp. BS20]